MIQHFLSMFGLLLEEKEKELSSSFRVFNSQIKIRWIPNKDKHSSVCSLYTNLHTTLICKVELLVNSKAGATHIVGFLSNIYSLRLSDFMRQSHWEKARMRYRYRPLACTQGFFTVEITVMSLLFVVVSVFLVMISDTI